MLGIVASEEARRVAAVYQRPWRSCDQTPLPSTLRLAQISTLLLLLLAANATAALFLAAERPVPLLIALCRIGRHAWLT